jgi:transmembrane sensor
MAEVHHLPSMDDVEREASAWIARLNADGVTAEDRTRFELWRGAHPRNARAYEALSATWQELLESGPLVRAVSFGQSMNAAAAAPPSFGRRRALIALAASVAGLGLGGVWYIRGVKEEASFRTAIGEHATIALPDGSSLELNSNSSARVDYRKDVRLIHLERGEAFFKVAHDTQRAFWVIADDSSVRAVGTEFNVYLAPAGLQVTVSEGAVKVAGERPDYYTSTDAAIVESAVTVTAGEQVDLRGREAIIRTLNPAQFNHSVAWRQGSLYFENQPLGAVADEMMRYTSLKINFSNDSLRHLPIGGTFQANPDGAEALLTLLRDGFGLTIERDGHEHVYVEGEPGK